MKITGIKTWPISVPFKKPFVVWRGVAKTKDHVIVQVETDEGITGIGEASPFLYYASETQQDVVSTIERYIKPLILGHDPFDLESSGYPVSYRDRWASLLQISGRNGFVGYHREKGGIASL